MGKKRKSTKSKNGRGRASKFVVDLNPQYKDEWKADQMAKMLSGHKHGARKEVIVQFLANLYDMCIQQGNSIEDVIAMALDFNLEQVGQLPMPAPMPSLPPPVQRAEMLMPSALPKLKEATVPKAGNRETFLKRVDSTGFM